MRASHTAAAALLWCLLGTGSLFGAEAASEWSAEEGLLMAGHMDRVISLAFSPDGKRLASGSYDNTVGIRDVSTGRLLRTLKGHTGSFRSVVYSPDGKNLATCSHEDGIRIWDAATGKLLRTIREPALSSPVAYSPDGKTLIAGIELAAARIWDAKTGAVLQNLESDIGAVTFAAYLSDGKRVISRGYDQIERIWNAETGKLLRAVEIKEETPNLSALSPDGTTAAGFRALDIHNGSMQFWDLETKEILRTVKTTRWMNVIVYSPDGKLLISDDGKKALLWDVQTGRQLLEFQAGGGLVESAAWSPDGKTLAVGTSYGTIQLRRLLNVPPPPELAAEDSSVPEFKAPREAELPPILKEQDEWKIYIGHEGGITSLAYSPDGSRIVSASHDGTARVWDAETAKTIWTLKGHAVDVKRANEDSRQLGLFSAAYSPDGKRIASGGNDKDKTARLWNAETGELIRVFQCGRAVKNLAFSPDSKTLAAGTYHEAFHWNVQTGEQTFILRGGGLGAAFSSDGKRFINCGDYGGISIWDGEKDFRVRYRFLGGDVPSGSVALSPDNKTLAAGGGVSVHLLDIDTGRLLKRLEGMWGVHEVAFSPDGKTLAVREYEGGVYLWNAETGQYWAKLTGNYTGGIAFSPDGKMLALGEGGVIRLWILKK